ncbi:hypothetical protein EJ05DRAFT_74456 [Pseudovirgaria hyperparasitica]|uniref:Uncharacterized protein n=1 Tax=Pseudovirgaria hyperparasitica TaxID=470096 RepID=A0A6A6W423_9PEZI|nr:uncharacterized protein EJ05DRAFT_74456 [Pseudovirgaria hyperparasitica]KAF2756716.1 hypothetical protein EJ05DRAFT_74456 [Pseudovirgaria hyperparasitica]
MTRAPQKAQYCRKSHDDTYTLFCPNFLTLQFSPVRRPPTQIFLYTKSNVLTLVVYDHVLATLFHDPSYLALVHQSIFCLTSVHSLVRDSTVLLSCLGVCRYISIYIYICYLLLVG